MRLQLGDVTFDSDARQLRRGRDEIHLSPKAFELLKTLIDHRPRAMSKNELHAHLWPATFVSDANLATLIGEIREALGDNARHARFVRTAQRFGYAFSGEAVEVPAANAPEDLVGNHCAPSAGGVAFCWLVGGGHRIPLCAGENILGREPESEAVHIDSPTVSRRHARISISANGAWLEDLDSKNGTFLRGKPVSAAVPLADGDEIRVGAVVLRFRMASTSHTATWNEPG